MSLEVYCAEFDEVESNVPTSDHGAINSILVSQGLGNEAKDAFFQYWTNYSPNIWE